MVINRRTYCTVNRKKKKRNEERERVTRLWHRPCNSINDVIFARRVIPHTKNCISGAKLSIQSDHTQRERHFYRLKKKKKTFFQDQRTTLSSEWGEFLQEARISNTVEKKNENYEEFAEHQNTNAMMGRFPLRCCSTHNQQGC